MSVVRIRSQDDLLEDTASDKPQGEAPHTPNRGVLILSRAIPSLIPANRA